jgi:hypothetical protein
MIDQVRVWQWLVVGQGVAVAGWLLRDNLGCELGSILSGEKLGIGRVLSEIGFFWCFVFLDFLDFLDFGFFGVAPDDRPGAWQWQWLVVAEGVAVAGWQWVENLGCELGSILSGEKLMIGGILSEIWRFHMKLYILTQIYSHLS